MLRLLRHYLPLRKVLLILSETAALSLVLAAMGTAHLWDPNQLVYRTLALENLGIDKARTQAVLTALMLSVLSQLAIAFNELYDIRISSSRYDRASRFVGSMGSATLACLTAISLAEIWELGSAFDFPGLTLVGKVRVVVFGLLVGFVVLFAWRTFFHRVLLRSSFDERVLILGSGKAGHTLAREMREHADAGYMVAGILAEVPLPDDTDEAAFDGESTGTADLVLDDLVLAEEGIRHVAEGTGEAPLSLPELVARLDIGTLVVALADRRRRLPIDDLLRCRLAGVPVCNYDETFEHVAGKISVEALRPSYLIFNEGFVRNPWANLLKRGVDISLSLCGLFFLWPVMLATGLAVRWTSPGPMLFTQERVGRNGRPFTLLKFRSMRADAESETGPVWATANDPRITSVGHFIRRTRLDELPQLLNVLAGRMSMVGPRPERPHFVDELAREIPYFSQRHLAKPGVTGWAQINYPYANTREDALQKLQFDLFYIKYQSFLFDLSILFNTIKVVLLRKGT
ncbi:MAG: glycosyl transferase [Planctomycetes bacterium]|jgi:sugar transferase (PEP-CTERM system associated)|nr:glycosyl transferase [Planctomycetota bacterium]MDP6408597.1 TIGR03013 family PEP-CTERM/XrtA system glycosyltransferase [Planctomycetota bacterium]